MVSNRRIEWIDIAKGIAIILVVLGHVVSSYHEAGLFLENALFNFSHKFVYSFHMALFMLISGFLVSKGRHDGGKKKQILQLLCNYGVPYALFSVLWILMKMLLSSLTNNAVSATDLLLIPVYPISFMWFIYALLIMQILQVMVRNRSTKFKIIHLLVAGGGYFVQPYLVKPLSQINFSECIISDFLNFYLFFLLGVYCGGWCIKKIENQRAVVSVLSGTVLIIGNIMTYIYGLANIRWYSCALALLGSLFIITLSQAIKHSSILAYCGKYSLPIYVLQGFAIAGTRIILTRFGLKDQISIIPFIVCTIAGCIFPLILHLLSLKIWKLEACFYPGKYIRIE